MIPNAAYKIIVDHTPSQADKDTVTEGLVVEYERLMGQSRDKEFSVFLKNDSGPAKRLSRGDFVIYYSSKITMAGSCLYQKFTAIGEIIFKDMIILLQTGDIFL